MSFKNGYFKRKHFYDDALHLNDDWYVSILHWHNNGNSTEKKEEKTYFVRSNRFFVLFFFCFHSKNVEDKSGFTLKWMFFFWKWSNRRAFIIFARERCQSFVNASIRKSSYLAPFSVFFLQIYIGQVNKWGEEKVIRFKKPLLAWQHIILLTERRKLLSFILSWFVRKQSSHFILKFDINWIVYFNEFKFQENGIFFLFESKSIWWIRKWSSRWIESYKVTK